MRTEIAGATVLGFIPVAYPYGVVILERWENGGMERVSAIVDDIEQADDYDEPRVFTGREAVTAATLSAMERAGGLL